MYQVLTSLRFILLWVLGISLSGLAAAIGAVLLLPLTVPLVLKVLILPWAGLLTAAAVVAVLLALLVGNVQGWLLRQKFRGEFRGWLIVSLIGAFVGTLAAGVMAGMLAEEVGVLVEKLTRLQRPNLPDLRLIAAYAALIGGLPGIGLSLGQSLVMGRYTRAAWLWVLAHIVSPLTVYALLLAGLTSGVGFITLSIPVLLLVLAAPGIVTGFTALFLLTLIRRPWWPEEY